MYIINSFLIQKRYFWILNSKLFSCNKLTILSEIQNEYQILKVKINLKSNIIYQIINDFIKIIQNLSKIV
jgi:hypothetical protein